VGALPRLPDLLDPLGRAVRGEVAGLDGRARLEDLALEFVATLDDSQSGHYFIPRRAADIPAFTMFTYAPQRQRLPVTARRTSSSVGFAFERRRATIDMTCPGVQKPHW